MAAAVITMLNNNRRHHEEESDDDLVSFDKDAERLLNKQALKDKAVSAEEKLDNWIDSTEICGVSKRHWVLKELLERCEVAMSRKKSYLNLFGFLLFTSLFIGVLFQQRRPTENFQMSSVMFDILPEDPNGELTQPMGSWEEVHQLIESQINEMWTTPPCGDGLCDSPHEFPAWGHPGRRYGCEEDCGVQPNVTAITLHLDYSQPTYGLLAQKITTGATGFVEPGPVQYNVCSQELFDVCWFAELQTLALGQILDVSLLVPDDGWKLVLEGDARYVRGYVTVNTIAPEQCILDCAQGQCELLCSAPNPHKPDQNSAVEAATCVDCNHHLHHLLAFEMCDYASMESGSNQSDPRTWQGFYLAQNFTGVYAQPRPDELSADSWDFKANLARWLDANETTAVVNPPPAPLTLPPPPPLSVPLSPSTPLGIDGPVQQTSAPTLVDLPAPSDSPTQSQSPTGVVSTAAPSPVPSDALTGPQTAVLTGSPTAVLTGSPTAVLTGSPSASSPGSPQLRRQRSLLSRPGTVMQQHDNRLRLESARSIHRNHILGEASNNHGAHDAFSMELEQNATKLALNLTMVESSHPGRSLLNSDAADCVDVTYMWPPMTVDLSQSSTYLQLPCGGEEKQALALSYTLQPLRTVTFWHESGNFDSIHALLVGGDCPGNITIDCVDDPNTQRLSYRNEDSSEAVQVYFLLTYFGNPLQLMQTQIMWEEDLSCQAVAVDMPSPIPLDWSDVTNMQQLSCSYMDGATVMGTLTIPARTLVDWRVNYPTDAPRILALELRYGGLCPGEQIETCTMFGTQEDSTGVNSNLVTFGESSDLSFNAESNALQIYYLAQDLTQILYGAVIPSSMPTELSYTLMEIPVPSCNTPIDLETITLPVTLSTEYGLDFLQVTCVAESSRENRDLLFTVMVPAGHSITVEIYAKSIYAAVELRAVGACPGEVSVQCEDSIDQNEVERMLWENTFAEDQPVYVVVTSSVPSQFTTFQIDYMSGPSELFTNCLMDPGEVVPGCMCHPSCATCGYYEWPDHEDDCVTCPEGSQLFVAYDDGPGYCGDSSFEYPRVTWCGDVPSCDAWFSFDKCMALKTGTLQELAFSRVPGDYPVFVLENLCLCKTEAPSSASGFSMQSTTTIAEACPEQYCSSYEECQGSDTVRLVGGRFPWEGRLVMEVRVNSDEVESSFAAATLKRRNRRLLDDGAEMYTVETSVCSNNWGFPSAYVACRSMGYSGVLQFALGDMTEGSSYWDNAWFPREDTDTMSMDEVAQYHSTFVGNVRCKGNEPSLMQCPLLYGWYNPNSLSESTSDPLSQQHPMPTCTQGQVVNLQCWPGADAYEQAACEQGLCCMDGCVSSDMERGNAINTWPLEHSCLDDASNSETSCNDAVHVQGDLKCDSKCRSSACFMDNWDCCPSGFLIDSNSQGDSEECCEPVSPAESQLLFKLNKFGAEMNWASTFRGLSFNRIIGGAIIHQQRKAFAKNNKRFNELYKQVIDGRTPDTETFGMNPYLYSVSKLYRGDLDPATYYEPSELKIRQTATGENQTVYTAFESYPMKGTSEGFPVVLSTGINSEKAQEILDYLKDGHFYDTQTDVVTVTYTIYNGQLDLFCIFRMVFKQTQGGAIRLSYSVIPIDVNLYASRSDFVRLGFELLYVVMVVLGMLSEASEAYKTWRDTGSLANHFNRFWNLIDAVSIFISLGSICLWITCVWYALDEFSIKLVYDIYTFPSHKWGRLDYKEENLAELAAAVHKLHTLGALQSAYVALSGVNLFLFLLRILKLLDFQPNMGILTRTISRAMGDLMHFSVLLVIVIVMYVAMGTIIFGPTIEVFSTAGRALQTTFDMLLGEFADTEHALLSHDIDNGLLTIPAVLFFYSFMSIVFLVILNFLLAIVVDAFADEKRDVGEHEQSMFTELKDMLSRWCCSATSAKFRERQSLKALRNRILRSMSSEKKTARSPYLYEKHDFQQTGEHWTPVRVLAMLDETYKVQLDESLLTRILKSDPDAPMSPDDLAEVAVAAFGRNQHPSVLQEPIQQKNADPMFVKLLQLQETVEAIGAQVVQVKQHVQRLESRIRATDAPPTSAKDLCQEKPHTNVGDDQCDVEATKGAREHSHTKQPVLGMASHSFIKDCGNKEKCVGLEKVPACDEKHASQPRSSRTIKRPEGPRMMSSASTSICGEDAPRASTEPTFIPSRNQGHVDGYGQSHNKKHINNISKISVDDDDDDDADTDQYDDRL